LPIVIGVVIVYNNQCKEVIKMTKKEWDKLHPQDKKEIINLIEFKERLKKWEKQKSIKQS
jgi:hypothetical protein